MIKAEKRKDANVWVTKLASNVKSRSSWGITAPTIPYLNFVSVLRTASGES